MKLTRLKVIFAAVALGTLGFSSIAFAQYVWLDERGVKQYSDMPPPASVPKKRILKEPGSSAPVASVVPTEPVAGAAGGEAVAKDKGPITTAERNADFQKRRTEQAEKDKKAAEETQKAAEKAKHCEQARAYQRALQSGERMARTDKNGERYFLNDEQRAKESQEAQRALDACK